MQSRCAASDRRKADWVGIAFIGQAHLLEEFFRKCIRLSGRHLAQFARSERDVFEHGQMGKQIEMLKDHADTLPYLIDVNRTAEQCCDLRTEYRRPGWFQAD